MILLILTVIPRLLVAIIVLVVFALLSIVATSGWDERKPMVGWRAAVMRFCGYLSMICAYLMGFIVRVHGWKNYKQAVNAGIRIALFNHVSYVDAFVLVGLMTCSGEITITSLSKESNKKLPILGSCVKGLQNIYLPDHRQIVKRGKTGEETKSSNRREDSVSSLISQRAQDKRFPVLCLAPEGTCGNGHCILQFRTGAFVSGSPVIPILLKYSDKNLNPAWTNINEGFHFLRLLCQFYNRVDITFLEPYYPSDEEKSNAVLYAENVRKLMATKLDVPMVNESYNHMYALGKLGLRVSWDGKTIHDPNHVIDNDGFVDLTPILDKKLS
eukprot:g3132.t1